MRRKVKEKEEGEKEKDDEEEGGGSISSGYYPVRVATAHQHLHTTLNTPLAAVATAH